MEERVKRNPAVAAWLAQVERLQVCPQTRGHASPDGTGAARSRASAVLCPPLQLSMPSTPTTCRRCVTPAPHSGVAAQQRRNTAAQPCGRSGWQRQQQQRAAPSLKRRSCRGCTPNLRRYCAAVWRACLLLSCPPSRSLCTGARPHCPVLCRTWCRHTLLPRAVPLKRTLHLPDCPTPLPSADLHQPGGRCGAARHYYAASPRCCSGLASTSLALHCTCPPPVGRYCPALPCPALPCPAPPRKPLL